MNVWSDSGFGAAGSSSPAEEEAGANPWDVGWESRAAQSPPGPCNAWTPGPVTPFPRSSRTSASAGPGWGTIPLDAPSSTEVEFLQPHQHQQGAINAGSPRATPSRGLGIAAFTTVSAMTLTCVLLAFLEGRLMGVAMVDFGGSTFDPLAVSQAAPALSDEFSGTVVLGFSCALIGVVAWIGAVIARTRGSAPALALAAIMIGLCAPILAFIALLSATTPFIHQLVG